MKRIEFGPVIETAKQAVFGFSSILVLLFCAAGSTATAQIGQQAAKQESTLGRDDSSANERARNSGGLGSSSIPDVEVVDQNGKPLHFYGDLIKGKSVIVNFIFTSCTYICPMQGANFSRIQAALGDRLSKEVTLVSVTVDPVTDTPERLKAWGQRFGARAGWTFVTGTKSEMDKLLRALTGDPSGFKEHSAIAFIGNYDRGVWIRTDALDDPARLINALDSALHQK